MKPFAPGLIAAVMSFACFETLHAQTKSTASPQTTATQTLLADDGDEILNHPWVVSAPSRAPEAYFTNLQDGAQVESPFMARFGLSMRGLVPAGKTVGRAGHHHLLVNQQLPLDFKKPLPFTDQYIHFGKGQMEALVDLKPGDYELRLLLADQGHIPYFVYSKPLHIKVTSQNKSANKASVQGNPRVELLSPGAGQAVKTPFRMQFHASGYNISHAATQLPDTHHFRLTMERAGQKAEQLTFRSGQTEAWLKPPKGDYTARLELVSNAVGNPASATIPAVASPVSFSVVGN